MIKDDKGIVPFLGIGFLLLFFFLFIGVVFFMKYLIIVILLFIGLSVLMAIMMGRIKLPGKTILPVLIVIIVLIFVAVGASFLNITFMTWKSNLSMLTDTEDFLMGEANDRQWTGHIELDDTKYVTSMYDNEEGEKVITTTAWIKSTKHAGLGGSCSSIYYYWYEILYADESGSWHDLTSDQERISWISGALGEGRKVHDNNFDTQRADRLAEAFLEPQNLVPLAFRTKGAYIGGIKVTLKADLQEYNCFLQIWGERVSGDLSKDEAYLESGIGFVEVVGVRNADGSIEYGGTTAEEGGAVIIHVECGAGVWNLKVFKTRTGETNVLLEKGLPEGCYEDVEYQIPMGAFTPSTDPLENQYIAHLYNSVIDQAQDDYFIVDKREYIPSEPTIEMSMNYAIVGEDVTITLTATVNEQTGIPIGSFNVWIWYGESKPGNQFSDYWIANNKVLQTVDRIDNETYQATYTFQAHKSGTISVEAKAIDIEGRASDPMKLKINAYWDEDDVDLADRLGIDWIWIIVILAIILLIVLYFVYKKYGRKR